MNELIGKRIHGIYLDKETDTLIFDTDKGYVSYTTEGDCCSTSWFAGMTGVLSILGEQVTNVESADLPDIDPPNDWEHIQVYGIEIQTIKGVCVVEFRNSSNGYYGGSIEYSSATTTKDCKVITEDWSE